MNQEICQWELPPGSEPLNLDLSAVFDERRPKNIADKPCDEIWHANYFIVVFMTHPLSTIPLVKNVKDHLYSA